MTYKDIDRDGDSPARDNKTSKTLFFIGIFVLIIGGLAVGLWRIITSDVSGDKQQPTCQPQQATYGYKLHTSLLDPFRSSQVVPNVGIIGLENQPPFGNTCFMNSILQCMMHIKKYYQYFKQDQHFIQQFNQYSNKIYQKMNGIQDNDPLIQFVKLLDTSYNSSYGSIISKEKVDFANMVYNNDKVKGSLKQGRQEDAQEFLIRLLDGIEEIENDTNITTDIGLKLTKNLFGIDIVEYQLNSTNPNEILDDTFKNLTEKMMALAIPQSNNGISIQDCFQEYTATEIFDNSQNTGKIMKKISIKQTSDYLIVVLKRFVYEWNGASYGTRKVDSFVNYGFELDLSDYMLAKNGTKSISNKYQLIGVTLHHGASWHVGHYTAFVKSINSDNWYDISDTNVALVRQENKNRIFSKDAYILFYQRKK